MNKRSDLNNKDPLPDKIIEKAKRILELIEEGEYAIYSEMYDGIHIVFENGEDYFDIKVTENEESCFYLNINKE